jgi:hypothetical protein
VRVTFEVAQLVGSYQLEARSLTSFQLQHLASGQRPMPERMLSTCVEFDMHDTEAEAPTPGWVLGATLFWNCVTLSSPLFPPGSSAAAHPSEHMHGLLL